MFSAEIIFCINKNLIWNFICNMTKCSSEMPKISPCNILSYFKYVRPYVLYTVVYLLTKTSAQTLNKYNSREIKIY